MPLSNTEIDFIVNGLEDHGTHLMYAALTCGDPFWRTLADAGWLRRVVDAGHDRSVSTLLHGLCRAPVKDAFDFLDALRSVASPEDFNALMIDRGKAGSPAMTWVRHVSRDDDLDEARAGADRVCQLIERISSVPGVFEGSVPVKIRVSLSRVRKSESRLEAEHSVLTMAMAGHLMRDLWAAPPAGDDAYPGAMMADQLLRCGVGMDLDTARFLFKSVCQDDMRSWMQWLSERPDGHQHMVDLVRLGKRLRPDPDDMMHAQALLARAALRHAQGKSLSLVPSMRVHAHV